MLAVAIVGLTTGITIEGMRLKRRHDNLSARFQKHARMEQYLRRAEAFDGDGSRLPYGPPPADFERMSTLKIQRRRRPDLWSRLVDHHVAMTSKYRRATRYPWLPVEPDPPEPEWQWLFRPFP
jgi:hypothetical protein